MRQGGIDPLAKIPRTFLGRWLSRAKFEWKSGSVHATHAVRMTVRNVSSFCVRSFAVATDPPLAATASTLQHHTCTTSTYRVGQKRKPLYCDRYFKGQTTVPMLNIL